MITLFQRIEVTRMAQASHSLLQGNIRRQLILITLPLIAGEILQQLYNTVDSLIIGRFLGTEAFAATGISGSVMNLFIFILSGFCVGVSVIFSREYGAGDMSLFRRTCYTAVVFGGIFTLTLSAVFIALTVPVLRLVATPDNLMLYCRRYLVVILGGLAATYYNNLFTGILRSVGDTRMSLVFLVVSVGANIILDLLLIAVIPLGIVGAAAATVLAQAISALACLTYIRRKYPELMCTGADAGFYKELLRQMFSYGISSAMHMSSLYIGKLMVQGIVNTCGTAVIAAFTATTRIEAFINSPGNGFAQATSIFVAQNRGAGNAQRTKQGMRESFILISTSAIVLSVVMYIISPYALRLFLDAGELESLAAGTAYLKIIFFFYILSYTGYFFVGTSRGYGRMTVPVVATTLQISVRVLVSWLLVGRLGLSAVAWATGIGWVFVVSYHFINFRRYTREEIKPQ